MPEQDKEKKVSDVALQRATLDDLDTFIKLEQSVAHLEVYLVVDDPKEATKEMESNIVFLIKKDSEVVGKIEYRMESSDHAYIGGLVIDPKFQGLGIGREAMTQILDTLKDIKRVDLATHPHNTPAITLYLSLGFVIESWKENYFGDGKPRIILAKIK